jgi:hypothetical protein
MLKLAAQSHVAFVLVQHQLDFQKDDRRVFIRNLMIEAVHNALLERATVDVRFGDPAMITIHPTIEPLKLTAAEMALIDLGNVNDQLLRQVSMLEAEIQRITGITGVTHARPKDPTPAD